MLMIPNLLHIFNRQKKLSKSNLLNLRTPVSSKKNRLKKSKPNLKRKQKLLKNNRSKRKIKLSKKKKSI
jgi:hypothetical protein